MNTAPELRDYQRQDVERIREHFTNGVARVCYQLPTGGGKTVVFCYILAAAAAKGSRVLVLAHRAEILEQIARTLTQFGIEHGVIAAGIPQHRAHEYNSPRCSRRCGGSIVLANSTSSLSTRRITPSRRPGAISLCCPDARVLGVSATPERWTEKASTTYSMSWCGARQSAS